MSDYLRVVPVGDSGLTVEFGNSIEPRINDRVLAFARAVEKLGLPGVVEVVPTYRSATVYVNPLLVDTMAMSDRLRSLAETLPKRVTRKARTIEIPVLYGGDFGPDLPELADSSRLPVKEVIRLHASVEYRVYMLGFSPGFPYMGRVPDSIATPRLPDPRAKVSAGSVGIAESQTGVYPQESPGGWRVIGRTPTRLYDPSRTNPFLLQAGDHVRFVPITRKVFDHLTHGTHTPH